MSSEKTDDEDRTSAEDPLGEEGATLQEGLDYYLEEGFYVFTSHYLNKRGYCCENGCRHCPYGFVVAEKL